MEKEIFSEMDVEHDIVRSIKSVDNISKGAYIAFQTAVIATGIAIIWVIIWSPAIALKCILLAVLLAAIGVGIWLIRREIRASRVRIEDYEPSVATLSHSNEEYYRQTYNTNRFSRADRSVYVYKLYFDDGRCFKLPSKNYPWSREHSMSDFEIYESFDAGSEFIVFTKRNSKRIAAVYPREYFDYKKAL